MEANVTITGYVGNEVEHRLTKAGWSTANFRIACTPRRRTEEGWVDRETIWIGVRCSRALADNVKASITKGDPVVVQGHLRKESWVDSEDVRHERLMLEASTVAHDLTRGTSAFRRTPKPAEEIEGPSDDLEVESAPPAPDRSTVEPVDLVPLAPREFAAELVDLEAKTATRTRRAAQAA